MEALWKLQAVEAASLIRSRSLSVEHYATACLERIASRDASVGAWAYLDPEQVLREARRLDTLSIRGPLHGLLIGIKDVFITQDMPTRFNSPIYDTPRQTSDASVVRTLRAAGALIAGKTATVEFASTGRIPVTRNPHDFQRTPGGSSSGSAAAVADFHVPFAIGTQTGGSIIRPASFCGTYAVKPTWGTICIEGAKAFAPTLDTVGWFARSVADLQLMFNVFASQPDDAPKLNELRVAICRTPNWLHSDEVSRAAMHVCEEQLKFNGIRTESLELPESFASLVDSHRIVMRREGGVSFLAEYRTDRKNSHEDLCAQVENLEGLTDYDLLGAYNHIASSRTEFDRLSEPFDAILTPSTVGVAPSGLTSTGSLIFNAMWTALHAPCINLAGIRSASSLPIGLTLTGPRFSDRRLLAAAAVIEPLLSGLVAV